MNPMNLLQLTNAWKRFNENHPKLITFLSAVNSRGMKEGSQIEIKVTAPDGDKMSATIRLTSDDIALFKEMGELLK